MKIIAENRKAKFDYKIIETFEAGIVLKGYEVKSVKKGLISLKGSFITPHQNELFLINATISLAKFCQNIKNYQPNISRKILLKKKEIIYLINKKQTEGLTIIPVSVYNKNGLIKLRIALVKGKKKFDKREIIKKRDTQRKINRYLKNNN